MSNNQFTSDMKAFVTKVIKQRLLIISLKQPKPQASEYKRYLCEVLGNNLQLIYADDSAAKWFKSNAASINNLIIKRSKSLHKQEKEMRDLLSRANSILIPEL